MFALGPEPQAHARGGPSGAARALIGRGAADLLDEERVDAAVGIEAGDPRQAAVDYDTHSVDGQRGLRDVGGYDDFTLAVGGQRGVLIRDRQFAVQGKAPREPPPTRERRTASMVRWIS